MIVPDRKTRFWKLPTISLVESMRIISEIHQLVGGSIAIARQVASAGHLRFTPNGTCQTNLPHLSLPKLQLNYDHVLQTASRRVCHIGAHERCSHGNGTQNGSWDRRANFSQQPRALEWLVPS